MPTTARALPPTTAIQRALGEFHITASNEQVLQIQQYIKILLVWNEKVNLTAIRDPLEILYRHICESMYAAGVIPLKSGRLAAVRSAGGFSVFALQLVQPD